MPDAPVQMGPDVSQVLMRTCLAGGVSTVSLLYCYARNDATMDLTLIISKEVTYITMAKHLVFNYQSYLSYIDVFSVSSINCLSDVTAQLTQEGAESGHECIPVV